MQLKRGITTKAYSVVIALTMIGFLLIVIVGVFNLVLKDMNDNSGMGDYMRAYFGAEASQELALLKIKQSGYGYYDSIQHTPNPRSIVLSQNPTDISRFNPQKDVFISYDLATNVMSYSGRIDPLGYEMIPLFYLAGNDVEHKVLNPVFQLPDTQNQDIVWNIVGESSGISGIGQFDVNTLVKEKTISGDSFAVSSLSIGEFLKKSSKNYLVLFNANNTHKIFYSIASLNKNEYFSQPKTTITSSAQIGKYKQNLSTILNNTQYLDTLKYSIYSN